MEIRQIEPDDDRYAISNIYEESWKSAYRNIIPDSYLESIPKGRWVPKLDREGMNSAVIIENGVFIGTSGYCGSRFSEFDGFGEILSIYFLPEYTGKGYGIQLLNFVIDELRKSGYKDVFLWVLEENMRARKFYEKAGFIKTEKYLDDNIGGKALREIAYCCHI